MPVQLTIKPHNAEIVRKGLQDLAAEVPKIGREQIFRALQRARSRLRANVRRPGYPIRWDSEKQKRAFFATDGFGRGIPSRRSGRYIKGWTLIPLSNGYRLENPASHAKYVGGDARGGSQSRIHQSRYPLFQDVTEQEIKNLPRDIEQHISYYARVRGLA